MFTIKSALGNVSKSCEFRFENSLKKKKLGGVGNLLKLILKQARILHFNMLDSNEKQMLKQSSFWNLRVNLSVQRIIITASLLELVTCWMPL